MSLCLLSIPIGFHLFPKNLTPEKQLIREGRELLNNREFELAEEKFNEAKKLAPELAYPWYWIAKVSLARQNLPVASSYVEQALKLQANHEPSLVLQIKILLLKGGTDTQEAQRKANQSYGVSDSLDQWLKCLENNNVFSVIVNTESKLEELCPYIKTPYQVN